MALEYSSLVEWILTGGIGALVVREVFKSIKYKKSNGFVQGSLKDIKERLLIITDNADKVRESVAVIKNELENIHQRCGSHLENQKAAFDEIKERINSLDEKLFEHIKNNR